MPHATTEVLNHQQVKDKINRISWQIYEEYQGETEIVLAGIAERGYILAQLLERELKSISPLKIDLHKLSFNKDKPLEHPFNIVPNDKNFNGKNIVVVDDVLKSGATLIYGVRYFLDFEIKAMNTAVLVDRSHKRFPVKADFKGLSLSTSTREHVTVNIEREPYSVEVS